MDTREAKGRESDAQGGEDEARRRVSGEFEEIVEGRVAEEVEESVGTDCDGCGVLKLK